MARPFFSIIIPAYNTEAYIGECLLSVEEQVFRDYEIIVVNDGSTDDTAKILAELSSNISALKIIEQKNKGVSSARNRGLSEASGSYIYFLDSDDLITPDALQTIYKTIESVRIKPDIVHFNGLCFNETPKHKTPSERYQRHIENRTGDIFLQLISSGQFKASVCLYVISRKYLKGLDLEFIEGQIHEDEAFSLITTASASDDYFIEENLFLRRERSDSITTSPKSLKNALGYYHSSLALSKWLSGVDLDKNKKYYIKRRIRFLFDTAIKQQQQTSKDNQLSRLIMTHVTTHIRSIPLKNLLRAILPLSQ